MQQAALVGVLKRLGKAGPHPADRLDITLLRHPVARLRLSVRALHRALRVARTIADLEGAERVAASHLSEALSFRDTGRAELVPCPVDQD